MPTGRPTARALLALVLGSFLLIARISLADPLAEQQVKAAFVYNFIKFTEWPETAFAGPDSPLVVLVVGSDPTADETETALKGKTAQGRKLKVKRAVSLADGGLIHVLYVCKEENAARLLGPLRHRHVLTISDARHFSRSGGIIGLVKRDNKISFEVNMDALERSGLKLNSQVLKMARIVRDAGQREEK